MITRACISINNQCNLQCKYCHFHEKSEYILETDMDILQILDNITRHIDKHDLPLFKLGFVGNGEPLLAIDQLKEYISHIDSYLQGGRIAAYTITNGLLINRDILRFFRDHRINVGFSIDGIREIHDLYRCKTHEKVMEKIQLFYEINGFYPSMNCTVGRETLARSDETIEFFKQFDSRITFSRMIGKYGIRLDEFNVFLAKAMKSLSVRTGGYDCTMYGGMCGAGMDNIFYANGKIYICGNCIDLPYQLPSSTELDDVHFDICDFDRTKCFKEVFA